MMDSFGKLLAVLVVVAGLNAALTKVGQAQSFAFSVGSGGGGHHHHHHGGWSFAYGAGPYWGPRWYAPPPVIYAPAPVVQPVVQPIYIQPQTVAPPPGPSPYISSNNSLGNPPTNAITASTGADDRIVIRNMGSAGLPVSFLIDGQDVELTEGGTRTFVGRTHRVVQYDRGGRFGSTQQDLTGGQYEFRVTASGWDLVRRPDIAPPASRTAVKNNSLPELSASR